MTAREAMDRADALLPNAVPEAEKLRLLAELDGRLREEAADLRGDDPPAAPVYTAASPLWLAAPWESLYLHWLQAEILYFQAEYTAAMRTPAPSSTASTSAGTPP